MLITYRFNTLIPLSLYVSLEIVKVFQLYLFGDRDMYHEETDTPFEAHTSTINEDCGQVRYVNLSSVTGLFLTVVATSSRTKLAHSPTIPCCSAK